MIERVREPDEKSVTLLSIVIANYNYGRFIEAAIRSVLDQQCLEVELIVVDGGSTDGSVDIIKKYAGKLAWWVSEPDSGQSNAFNKGFAHARGKYLTWVNADDLMVTGCLKKVIPLLRRYPETEWFTGNFFRFDVQGRVLEIGWGPHCYPFVLQRRNSPIVAFGPSTIFSRALWERVGRIDESLHYIMDTEMWMRFIVKGVKQRRINCFCWAFRMHEDSKTAEFGVHVLSNEVVAKMRREFERAAEGNGYRMSRVMHLTLNLWRMIDGSLLKRFWLMCTFRFYSPVCEAKLLMPRGKGFFSFTDWCVKGWKNGGGQTKPDICIIGKLRAHLSRLFCVNILNLGRLVVMGSHRIETRAWPWCCFYEIIPMMWDLWPDNYEAFLRFCRRCDVKTVFCTSSQSVAWINENCPEVKAIWMPEAIDLEVYRPGPRLAERTIDVLNYGRQKKDVNEMIQKSDLGLRINHVYNRGEGLVFKTFEGLIAGIKNAKMAICYPMVDTRPAKAKGVETLTQRYWECMASGTIVIGHAPKELVDVCGYNPVVELGDSPVENIKNVLDNLSQYQELADRNRAIVEERATWNLRMKEVMAALAVR